MSSFTPGPWKMARSNPGMTTGLIGPTRDKRLGTIHTGCAEYVANAHLIAAAPTMADYIAKRAAEGDQEAVRILGVINGTA